MSIGLLRFLVGAVT